MEMAQLDLLQFVSMLTSIVSLAWSFAFYKAAMKREALDFDVNPIGRIVLILSNLCMVTSRLTALVVFAYRCTASSLTYSPVLELVSCCPCYWAFRVMWR